MGHISAETELARFEGESEGCMRSHLRRRRLHMKQPHMRLRPVKEPEQSTERDEGRVVEERSINLPDRSLRPFVVVDHTTGNSGCRDIPQRARDLATKHTKPSTTAVLM